MIPTTSITYRRIWQIAYPIILGSVAQNIINVTDTAFLGRVGVVALGAAAIGGLFYIVIFMLGFGFAIGTQIIVARRNGEEKYTEIGQTMEQAAWFMLPLALLMFVFMQFLSGSMLSGIIGSEDVFRETDNFIRYRSYGIFFAFTNLLFRAFYIGIARTKVITWSTMVLALVNVFLDYSLIFGHFGFPEMGIRGAALASVIAEASATLFFAVFTISRTSRKKYDLFSFRGFRKELFTRIFMLASPIMVQNFLSIGSWLVFFLMVEKMGELPLAVSNVIRSFYIVLMIPIWGFSSATNTLVSYVIGARRRAEVPGVIFKNVILTFIAVTLFVLISLGFPEQILSIYSNDAGLISASIPVLKVVSLAAIFLSVSFILFNGVSGTGKTQYSLIIEFITIVVYLISTYLMVNVWHLNIVIIWTTEYIYSIIMGLLSFLYLYYQRWKQ
ncbi:MAG: MATE family efflux transporter [Bacteroidetes bacterium]|nr:MATE family efflux transporter [Bacteroidota bacterium]